MSKHIAEAEKILAEYGRRMFESHARYFDSNEIDNSECVVTYTHVSPRSSKRILKRALILCATMILIMSLTVVVCSALGLQIFNYKFDFRDGYIVITNLDEENGSYYYKPEYIADNYLLLEVGNNQNNIKEVRKTGKYFARVLAKVLEAGK